MGVVTQILFLLVCGTLNTLTTKWQFTISAEGIDGHVKRFEKPWWGNFAMFLAMTLVLLLFPQEMKRKAAAKKAAAMKEPLLTRGGVGGNSPQVEKVANRWGEFKTVFLPAFLDLLATGCQLTGLLYVSASVWQMLRGGLVVFSAIGSILLLGRKISLAQWGGIFLCVAGIALVGLATIKTAADDTAVNDAAHPSRPDKLAITLLEKIGFNNAALLLPQPEDRGAHPPASAAAPVLSQNANPYAWVGVTLVLLAQIVCAAQVVIEEKLLKQVDPPVPGTLVVGFEGLWGCLLMILIFFPLFYVMPGDDVGGRFENTPDTLVMIWNDHTLQLVMLLYYMSCSTYNCARIMITTSLSAVHFSMIDASRTLAVWILDLAVGWWGGLQLKAFSESWDWVWSPVQLLGFFVLILGQLIYSEMIPRIEWIEKLQANWGKSASKDFLNGVELPTNGRERAIAV